MLNTHQHRSAIHPSHNHPRTPNTHTPPPHLPVQQADDGPPADAADEEGQQPHHAVERVQRALVLGDLVEEPAEVDEGGGELPHQEAGANGLGGCVVGWLGVCLGGWVGVEGLFLVLVSAAAWTRARCLTPNPTQPNPTQPSPSPGPTRLSPKPVQHADVRQRREHHEAEHPVQQELGALVLVPQDALQRVVRKVAWWGVARGGVRLRGGVGSAGCALRGGLGRCAGALRGCAAAGSLTRRSTEPSVVNKLLPCDEIKAATHLR